MVTKKVKSRDQRMPIAKADAASFDKTRHMGVTVRPGASIDRIFAEQAFDPALGNAFTALEFSKNLSPDLSLLECVKVMKAEIQAVNGDKLSKLEGMLTGQAMALNAIFNNFSQRAINTDVMPKLEAYLRLALKAQSQCRTTIEAIAEMKCPKPATFIRQANVGHNVQVNNGQPTTEGQSPAHEKI